ncbi:unnamed protein product [Mytilus coruscus]|uniref:Uncharacterized protein n=1 Tax=Mytilus coruscus TaxID=42192 RepID=A0A6J8EJW1_MYTCO|nr:unnamed protein product [Mytilus coruscus]
MNIADNSYKKSDVKSMLSPNTHVKRSIPLKVTKILAQSKDKSPVKVQAQKQSSPTKCNIQYSNSIQDEQIIHLKTKLARSEKLLKSKDSQLCKLDSEMNTLKKDLATNRAYTQDNKISNLSDKLMDMKIDLMSHGNQYRRQYRQKRSNRHNTEINDPGSDNLNSCTPNSDNFMEEELCLRTDEIPDSQSGASLDLLDKQGQKKHIWMKENQISKTENVQ